MTLSEQNRVLSDHSQRGVGNFSRLTGSRRLALELFQKKLQFTQTHFDTLDPVAEIPNQWLLEKARSYTDLGVSGAATWLAPHQSSREIQAYLVSRGLALDWPRAWPNFVPIYEEDAKNLLDTYLNSIGS